MADAGIPYLHMKEFGNPDSNIYGRLKSDPEKEAAFMRDVIKTIKGSARGSVATTVVISDFREFNAAHGLDLDPYAFAIYCCLFQLRSYYPDDEIDIIFDRFDDSITRVGKALKYALTDWDGHDLKPGLITPIPLQKNESWRNVLALQAADLIAWEVRKYRRERFSQNPPDEIREDREALSRWAMAQQEEERLRDRQSFQSLRRGMVFRECHMVADAYFLATALSRHPDGWGC